MVFIPASEVVGGGDRVAWVLHGILGNRKNWRGIAARVAERRPDFHLRLIDHRNHGESGPAPPPNTLEAIADDLDRLAAGGRPEVVLGHSFGGKVALAWAARRPAGLRQVWSLDAPPFASDPAAGGEVAQVIQVLGSVPQPFARRNDVVPALLERGLPESIARWMTTNLRRDDDGFRWSFELDAAAEMIADYFRHDFSALLDRAEPEVIIVRAARSDRWAPPWLERLLALPPRRYAVLPDAGHWLHADNPDGLVDLLAQRWVD